MSDDAAHARGAERPSQAAVVLPCRELEPTRTFFQERLGFRLLSIFPAEDPAVVELGGHGLRLRLERREEATPGTAELELRCPDPAGILSAAGLDPSGLLEAPNGTRVRLSAFAVEPEVPALRAEFLVREAGQSGFDLGRAGMRYRDLVPGRLGGHFIASHIRIDDEGPVPDYVHFHLVRFQAIFCVRGWVRVVYEDQGPPFELHAGDGVLQPPGIRHRVLAASKGLEVVEVAIPAAHETHVDHELVLPSPEQNLERLFGGQRFLHHQERTARWRPTSTPGIEECDPGLATASAGAADVRLVRATSGAAGQNGDSLEAHAEGAHFFFVLSGEVTFATAGSEARTLAAGDSGVVPPGLPYRLAAHLRMESAPPEARWLLVAIPRPKQSQVRSP